MNSKMEIKKLFKKWQVVLWAVSVFISLVFILNIVPINKNKDIGLGNGLDYGLDFAGGIQIQLQLERPVDSNIMAIEKGILENRLNSMGLKDIPVRSWGDQYILIQVAGASPEETTEIENILKQQARFETMIDGALAVTGDEISVDLSPGGTQLYREENGFGWSVGVKHTPEGACRFGKVGDKKRGRPVDIFIDRPDNTTILMDSNTYFLLGNITPSGEISGIFYGDTPIKVIENRSAIPVVALKSDVNSTLMEIMDYKAKGYTNVIIAENDTIIPDTIRNKLEENGLKTTRSSIGNQSYSEWIMKLTGLRSSPKLNFDTRGECVYSAIITGVAQTLDEARLEIQRNQVLLTSGNLPVKATVESKSTTPPTLGVKFLKYSFYIGVIALLTIGLVIFLRYRRLGIAIPIMLTDISEVLIVLGLASLINWNLDLPSIAGIIAAVGTGVNDQIVMTDETLRHRRKERKEIISVTEQIRRAFFIIFTAAATIIAAMIPILGIGAGMLKGFAFTTIMGVLVGIFITRQGYAKVLQEFLKE